MSYNFDSSEVSEIKTKMQTVQKEMEEFLMSQQYQKALSKRKVLEDLSIEADKKKKKRTVPKKERLHIIAKDIQRVIHQMT